MTENVINTANEELSVIEEEPQSLEDFFTTVRDNPSAVSHSIKYILEAIESCGTRTVVESGEEQQRYKFFDDPYGDGEHAILGNTEVLNDFVNELRRMASEEGENSQILWFKGPTASGKSELKRCFTNGIRGYSRTQEGERYTVEWNIKSSESSRMGTYGTDTDAGEWYRSPVGTNPLSVIPPETRQEFLDELNGGLEYPVEVDADIDPFSQEVYDYLKKQYSDDIDNLFENIVSDDHLRVVRRQMKIGDGIGVLHVEDGGSVKERLVGSWMPEMLSEYQSRGRKNPQAFAYDGVLSQGNGGITIIEDAAQHIDAVQKLMNIPEENVVKLDQKIPMEIDTMLLLISNPDMKVELQQYQERGSSDPLRALRRRLNEFEISYLTNLSLEAQLIRRLLVNDTDVWMGVFEERMEKVVQPLELYDAHFEPHAVEAAAMCDVVSRIYTNRNTTEEVYDKALALDRGYHITDTGEKIDFGDADFDTDFDENEGMPVTYTIDVLSDIAQEQEVILPSDVLDAMYEQLSESPLFSEEEEEYYHQEKSIPHEYIDNQLRDDVLNAMLKGRRATKDEIESYVNGLMEWVESDGEEEERDFDPYALREFEKEYFLHSENNDEHYDGTEPVGHLKKFREEKIINPIKSFLYSQKDRNFEIAEVAISQCEELDRLFDHWSWGSISRYYENVDFSQWSNPPSGTDTAELKEKTINNMVEDMDYSEKGAERVTRRIIEERDRFVKQTVSAEEIINELMEETDGT